VLPKLGNWPINRVTELTPTAWKAAKQIRAMNTTFTVERAGRELDVKLTWSVDGTVDAWKEHHPYGMGTATEEMADYSIYDVNLLHEVWPDAFKNESVTEEEFARARAEALEKAREAPHEYIAA
jgi:hypothetical protein